MCNHQRSCLAPRCDTSAKRALRPIRAPHPHTHTPTHTHTHHPTPPFAAPEQLLAQRCTLAADIYSLGLVLAELTTGQVVKRRGEWQLPRPPEECPAAVAELIRHCTQPEPTARPSAAEVLQILSEA